MRLRSVASLVLVALVAGAIAAHADSGGAPRPARAPVARVVSAPATPFLAAPGAVAYAARRRSDRSPAPDAAGRAQGPGGGAAVAGAARRLRDPGRPRTDEDTLPPEAVTALRARGLSPVSTDSARLLRSTQAGGRAWVVPVPDAVGRLAASPASHGKSDRARAWPSWRSATPRAWGRRRPGRPRPRALAATVAPCAGADHSMLSISGIVPNGVPAVFLTAPDGTAVRADVKDNGYEFLLPKQRTAEQRYVVWTGGDGTPHVQPVVAFGRWTAKARASAPRSCRSRWRACRPTPCSGA